MKRNTKPRENQDNKGFEVINGNLDEIFSDVYLRTSETTFENLEHKSIPGVKNEDPGDFPYNIEKIFWIHHKGFEDYTHDSETYILAMNTKKKYVYFKYITEGCSCGISDEEGEIYCSKKYEDLINFAMNESEYQTYIKETKEIWNWENQLKRRILPFHFDASCEGNRMINLEKELKNKKIFLSRNLMKNLPYTYKGEYKAGEIKDFSSIDFCIGFEKFMGWGYEYLKNYLRISPYIYIIEDNDKDDSLNQNLIEEKNTRKMNPLDVLNNYDGIMYNDYEGKYWKLRKGFKVKLMYKFNFTSIRDRYVQIQYEKIIPELTNL